MLKNEMIVDLIEKDKYARSKRFARVGQKYYDADHDIKQYKILFYNKDGKLEEDLHRSNVKITHPFFTELVEQKVQYGLSDIEITSKDETLNNELAIYFDDQFKDELSECALNTAVRGFDYMYGYKDVDGRTKFAEADGLGVIEVRAQDNDDNIDYIIYYYLDRVDEQGQAILKIEVWDSVQRHYFLYTSGNGLVLDPNAIVNPRPHYLYKKQDRYYTQGNGYNNVPWFRLDNNKKRVSDLKPIKALIDDYDLMSCGLSNNLEDISEGIVVVKGFEGTNSDELYRNLKSKKVIGVGEDGDLDIRTVDIPYEARKIKLDLDRENIYKFGMGFDSSQVGDGNITNIVIKSRYSLLDLKCNKMEKRIKKLLRQLLEIVIDEINERNKSAYTIRDVKIELIRELPSNASDNATIEKTEAETQQIIVNTLLNAAAIMGNETIIEELCNALDINFSDVKDKIVLDAQTEFKGLVNELE